MSNTDSGTGNDTQYDRIVHWQSHPGDGLGLSSICNKLPECNGEIQDQGKIIDWMRIITTSHANY